MKKTSLLALCLLAACQANSAPQNLEDLLHLTDRTTKSICTVPLTDIRKNLTAAALDEALETELNLDLVAEKYADDPVEQILIVFRRAALKRRLNVKSDNIAAAENYYAEFDDNLPDPNTLAEHHTKMHYWSARLSEQGQIEDQASDNYNLRFCVLNEARAAVHSDSRAFILKTISDEPLSIDDEILENIHHETYYGEAFKNDTISVIFSEENLKGLSLLDTALIRGETAFLPFDPKESQAYWAARDKEIDALLSHISSHNYDQPASKLTHMTMIDQNLRRLWNLPAETSHFATDEEFEAFKMGISDRVIKVDEFNTEQLQSMLKGRGWFRDDKDGEGAGSDAWLIAQHADLNPEFQQEALTLIEAELGAPGVSKSNYAYLYDRVQMRFSDSESSEKRIQRYGTQGRCTGPGTWEPSPVEDPENLDARRAEVGLGPIAEYKTVFKTLCTEDQR